MLISDRQLAANRAHDSTASPSPSSDMKSLQAELPNEPILEAQPEENEPTYAPPDEPISTPQPEPQAPNATGLSTSEDAARNILQDLDVPAGHDNFLVGQAVSPVTAGRSRRLVAARLLSGVDAVPDLPVEPSGRGTRAD